MESHPAPDPRTTDDTSGESATRSGTDGPATRSLGWIVFLAAIVIGILAGSPIVGGLQALLPAPRDREILYWTSPSNPQERSDKPGKNAMGMPLVPVYKGIPGPTGPHRIDPVLQERSFWTVPVTKGPLVRTIKAPATIHPAEPLIQEYSLKVGAWLEQVPVDYTGQQVKKGEPLFSAYSPDLVAGQRELLLSAKAAGGENTRVDDVVAAQMKQNLSNSKQRLRYWDITQDQIDAILQEGKPRKAIAFVSPTNGYVLDQSTKEGDYHEAGERLYRFADLSTVWVDIYISAQDLDHVKVGQEATLATPSFPDRTWKGKVTYRYPELEPVSRTLRVRLEFANPDNVLKPGLFVTVVLAPDRFGEGLSIPLNGFIDTGTRRIAYVSPGGGMIEPREIQTGSLLDEERVVVRSGLSEGEAIIVDPTYLLDAEVRLRAVNRNFVPSPLWRELDEMTNDPKGTMGGKSGSMPAMRKGAAK
ncbi:Cation efflux system protein CusB precursor [Planctomycetes bacterium Pan216]|uniref:Cation efflux system protein CusB n=1 Tax=Kolteria novifilia TaxID=2527975 RepID=A0A518B7R8_9BACT|nr:Cation efflux system protein CusB precursor [Planctomycetes bacterium Pan216]